jgi:hypothetical protein
MNRASSSSGSSRFGRSASRSARAVARRASAKSAASVSGVATRHNTSAFDHEMCPASSAASINGSDSSLRATARESATQRPDCEHRSQLYAGIVENPSS